MPRANPGPKLVLYGPDTRFGARAQRGFTRYLWYITWSDKGRKSAVSTGIERITGGQSERVRVEAALEAWLARRRHAAAPPGPRRPDQFPIAEALRLYADEHGPSVAAPQRIAYAIESLLDFWGDGTVSSINKVSCARYVTARARRFEEAETIRKAAVVERGRTPAPLRPLSSATPRRELGVLQTAINHCVAADYLTSAPVVTLPEKGRPRDRWLTRQELGRLVWAARKVKRSGHYLPYLILLLAYHGPRREAATTLQWQPNPAGGDVDLDREMIDFQGGARRTKKERPYVPIARRLVRFLRCLKNRTTGPYVFGRAVRTEDGQLVWKPIGCPNAGIAAAAEMAGLGHVTCHTLKHTAVTWVLQGGVPIWQAANWFATSAETIEKVYGHSSPDRFKDVQRVHR